MFAPSIARVARPADLDTMVDALTTAFFDDPVWGPVFPDLERRAGQASAMWRLMVKAAMRYPWTFVSPRGESVAVWVPAGGVEMTTEEVAELEATLVEEAGKDVTAGIFELMERFEAARPAEPHYYLSLLGTHDDYRGKGIGMALLRDSLARVDALGAAAYLESSNPAANDARYARLGFEPHGEITTATGHVITTMWRPAKAR